jgi:hypothetical protein
MMLEVAFGTSSAWWVMPISRPPRDISWARVMPNGAWLTSFNNSSKGGHKAERRAHRPE